MRFRVAVIGFIHESNTFTSLSTDMQDFRSTQYFLGQDVLAEFRNTGSEIGGCIDVVEEKGWAPDYIVGAHAQPGGPVSEAARTEITEECLRRLKDGGPYDGIFVALHGAMVTETDQDGESQFLRELRTVVGDDVPVAITLDLHANVFDELAELAQIAVSFRTYPHVDLREVGREASERLDEAMAGRSAPKIAVHRPPVLLGCDDGRTSDDGPMCRLLESAAREMDAPGILNVAINAGFPDADVWASGPSVLVTYDSLATSREAADAVAGRICDEIWACRDTWNGPIPLDDCMLRLKAITPANGPVVIADYADNPGGGAHSDCTALISALLDAGVTNAAAGALLDPEAAEMLAAKGVGAKITLAIGGKTDPTVGGGPIEVTGTVMAVSDGHFHFEGPMFTGLPASTGTSVCLRVDGLDIMIVSERMQVYDQNILRVVGIEPAEKAILAVKSMNHFKGAFRPIASEIIVTDAGGLCSPDLSRRTYTRLRRPVFPLDTL
ncbi:M81 family metallopeptidase [Stappia stellulata]|uniref:M81 family metallopeptidase n=1 Tax=Stappia stellulata TaxID=71235 RepID=UPI0004025476|nr:M81 family metallopeptidase [Stappia stellulata]